MAGNKMILRNIACVQQQTSLRSESFGAQNGFQQFIKEKIE